MDSVTAMMISLAIAGVLCGILVGVGLFKWKEHQKQAKYSADWVDVFLTDVRERIVNYMLKHTTAHNQAEGFRNLIATLKYPQDFRLVKKWYEYTSGLLLTLAKSEEVSGPFKAYLEYVADVLCEIAVNAHLDEANKKK
jgi:hypothetical protein